MDNNDNNSNNNDNKINSKLIKSFLSFSIGRLGELKKIIDCNVSQLLDEQPTDSGHDRHVTDTGHNKITDTGQRQLCVQQEQTENKIIRKNEKNDELDNSR